MKRLVAPTLAATAFALASTLMAGSALAADGDVLAKEAGCLKCHALENKKKGPAIKKIVADYKKNGISGDKAIAKMKEGHEPDDLKGIKSEADTKLIMQWFLAQ